MRRVTGAVYPDLRAAHSPGLRLEVARLPSDPPLSIQLSRRAVGFPAALARAPSTLHRLPSLCVPAMTPERFLEAQEDLGSLAGFGGAQRRSAGGGDGNALTPLSGVHHSAHFTEEEATLPQGRPGPSVSPAGHLGWPSGLRASRGCAQRPGACYRCGPRNPPDSAGAVLAGLWQARNVLVLCLALVLRAFGPLTLPLGLRPRSCEPGCRLGWLPPAPARPRSV